MVQFGSVAVGTSAQRCIELINVSPVSCDFFVLCAFVCTVLIRTSMGQKQVSLFLHFRGCIFERDTHTHTRTHTHTPGGSKCLSCPQELLSTEPSTLLLPTITLNPPSSLLTHPPPHLHPHPPLLTHSLCLL